MKYYQHPQSFTWNGYPFNWSTIPNHHQSGSNQATLVRFVGQLVNMYYSSSGSWATPGNVKDGISLLGYNVTQGNHNFDKVEKELLNYNRPVIMVGNGDNVPLPSPINYIGQSHYWVCDGARKVVEGRFEYFTEWQPYGNGTFVAGWNSIDFPAIRGGVHYLYFHMNWGWGGTNDGWFAFNNVNSGNGNFKYARQDFYITRP